MLSPGTRLGPYEILSPLGAGGMGEVYRARDTRLERTVAIKILPEALAGDPQFRERFDREARAISQLDHPHICALYDVGDEGGTAFLVMQHLEGETLTDRLAKGALPLDHALRTAIEIAGALAAAHRAGIVHRDLKPGNIMLTKAGAKLLDFGLAKSTGPVAAGNLSMLPTTPPNLTQQGTILGTFQYMAPEQLEGQDADARTDIFAFGAVLYEMLTGRRAFAGKSQASLIGSILKDEPAPPSTVRPITPKALDRIVATCLAKDPDDRWQTTRDLQRELTWVSQGHSGATTDSTSSAVAVPVRVRGTRRFLAPALVAAAIVLAAAAGWALRTSPALSVTQFEVLAPPGMAFVGGNGVPRFAVSPDGQSVIFQAGPPGGPWSLWLRRFDTVTPRSFPLTETTDNTAFQGYFWFPDGRYVGFFDQGAGMSRLDVESGTIQPLFDGVGGNQIGGTANGDGVILFSTIGTKGILRATVAGGAPAPATVLDVEQEETAHLWPWFLPDGRHFLYLSQRGTRDQWAVYVGSLDSAERTLVVRSEYAAVFAPPNHLLYTRGDSLLAQELDLDTFQLSGEPVFIQQPAMGTTAGRLGVSASVGGVLVHVGGPAGTAARRTLVWSDRDGREEALSVPPRAYTYARISPDGTRVALDIRDLENDVWIWEFARETLTRVTFGPSLDTSPTWTPDSRRVVFASDGNLFWRTADGTGAAERLTKSLVQQVVSSIAPDGSEAFFDSNVEGQTDLFAVGLGEGHPVRTLLRDPSYQRNAMISPDGRWIAYQSQESSRDEIFVRPYPDVEAGRWMISTAGGTRPRWARSGQELFYVAPGNRLMSVRVGSASNWSAAPPVELFVSPNLSVAATVGTSYDVSPDGSRILLIKAADDAEADAAAAPTSLVVIQNWQALLTSESR